MAVLLRMWKETSGLHLVQTVDIQLVASLLYFSKPLIKPHRRRFLTATSLFIVSYVKNLLCLMLKKMKGILGVLLLHQWKTQLVHLGLGTMWYLFYISFIYPITIIYVLHAAIWSKLQDVTLSFTEACRLILVYKSR